MIKKLMSLLFEEEEITETIEEPKSEPVRKSVTRESSAASVKTEVPLPQEARQIYIEKKEPVSKEPEVRKKEPEKKISAMTADEPKPKTRRSDRPQVQQEYEFTPVISPIFGVLDAQGASVETPVVKKKSAPVKSSLGTVISPIYGMEKPVQDKVEQIEEKLQEKQPRMENEPVVSVSLDELLQTEKQEAELPVLDSMEEAGEKKVITSQNLSLFDDDLNS